MSALALEIDQTLQQLDAASASKLERMVREAMALVKSRTNAGTPVGSSDQHAFSVVPGDASNGFQVIPAKGRVVTSEMVQHMMEDSEAA